MQLPRLTASAVTRPGVIEMKQIINSKTWIVHGLIISSLLLAPVMAAHAGLTIANVSAEPAIFKPAKDKTIKVGFTINEPAHVQLNIYDARDYLIRNISSKKVLSAGNHTLTWDGRSASGQPLPPEAYYYTLEAKSATDELSEKPVVYDLTDKTGGETVYAVKVEYNPKDKKVHYALPATARIFMRVGIEKGNIYGTLINGAIRQAGQQTWSWDGWDQSHVFELGTHPKLQVYVEGIALSDNAILIDGPPPAMPTYVSLKPDEIVRRKAQPKPPGVNIHARHQRELCRDFPVTLTLPDNIKQSKQGLPLITGKLPVKMDLRPEDVVMLESQRFELVYYLNNNLVYENEVSYVPYTWIWDPKTLSGGTHYMTAVGVGFDGHFGMSTIKFQLAKTGK